MSRPLVTPVRVSVGFLAVSLVAYAAALTVASGDALGAGLLAILPSLPWGLLPMGVDSNSHIPILAGYTVNAVLLGLFVKVIRRKRLSTSRSVTSA